MSFAPRPSPRAREETGLTNTAVSVGRIRGVVEVVLRLSRRIYDSWVTPASEQIDRRAATGFWLRLHAANAGLSPLAATATRGILTATAAAGGSLTAGTELTAPGLPAYTVDGEIDFDAGTFRVPVTCTTAGAAGNLADGTALTPPDALESVTAAAGWITVPGADDEDDARLRARIADRWEALGDGHPAAQYRLVALSVPSVAEAAVLRAPRGPGSVTVALRTVAGAPTMAEITAVETALDAHMMVARDILVTAPPRVPVEISVTYTGTAAAAAVRRAVTQYVASLRIGAVLTEEGLYAAGRSFPGALLASVEMSGGDRIDPGAAGIVQPNVTAAQF